MPRQKTSLKASSILLLGIRGEYYQLNDSITALKPIIRAGVNIKLYPGTLSSAFIWPGIQVSQHNRTVYQNHGRQFCRIRQSFSFAGKQLEHRAWNKTNVQVSEIILVISTLPVLYRNIAIPLNIFLVSGIPPLQSLVLNS